MSKTTNCDSLEQLIIQIVNEKKPQSVEQLATYVREKIPLTNHRIIAAAVIARARTLLAWLQSSP